MELSISNVINVSVSQPGTGLGKYNTSNIALFTEEVPAESFGDDGYKIYKEPSEIETDFGTNSKTYQMALAAFNQQPNMLAGDGYLVVIPFDDGIYTEETLAQAITRTKGLVAYFGIISTKIYDETEMLAAAAVVQNLNKIIGFVSRTAADLDENGLLDLLRQNGYTHSRGLYYGGGDEIDSLKFMAGYFGRGLSVDFTGSLTTITMHLKDIVGSVADSTMTETLLTKAMAAGVDTYPSIQGVAKVFCSGKNEFFDDVYNLLAFVGDIQIAGFNVYATNSTKVAQTEGGVDLLRDAYDAVCEQYVRNQFLAPGKWNRPDTFGVQADFLRNISQRGYYIYFTPIAQQAATDREDRKSPLCQMAIKYAGAQHSGTVIVNINK